MANYANMSIPVALMMGIVKMVDVAMGQTNACAKTAFMDCNVTLSRATVVL